MNFAIWGAQVVLAFAFLASGANKVLRPRLALQAQTPYVADLSDSQTKIIGSLEVLAAVGLILPSVLKVVPVLSAAAAGGLVLTMIGAIVLHVRRGEADARLTVNFILLALALVVAWARLGPYRL
jgi:uncharacterized membrane protein YphA (DoxX/SURF4 family)